MSMKKISELQLETTANYQSLSKLNVRFWNQDLNTAELRFLITRDNFPLSLSIENVKIIIVLEQGNNFISSEDFEINSEVDGVASFLIPNDFMSVASGEVTGQVYVGTLDSDEVIVQRKFTFQVENDLLSSIPSELKLQYIKTFSDLADSISTRLFQIEEDMAAMEDYVAAVNQATTDGLNALNNLVNAKTVEYNDNHADKLALINTTVDGYVQDFLDQRSYIDTKYAEFQTAVSGSGVVKDTDTESWQKHKLTKDDGNANVITGLDMENIEEKITKAGIYWLSSVTNGPVDINGILLAIHGVSDSYKKFIYAPHNSNRVFLKSRNSSVWSDWEEVAIQNSNDPFETVVGSQSKANVAENNAKVYTDSKYNSRNTVIFEGAANGVGTVMNLSETLDNFIVLYVYGSYPGGDFVVTSDPEGSERITISNTNILDTSGDGGGMYELGIQKTNRTRLTISNDVYFDLVTQEGSGANANRYTINKIVGVRK